MKLLGLLLLGLALLTWNRLDAWQSEQALWLNVPTVRGHMNHRTAARLIGDWPAMLADCTWLLHAAATGDPDRPTPKQTRDIRAICFER